MNNISTKPGQFQKANSSTPPSPMLTTPAESLQLLAEALDLQAALIGRLADLARLQAALIDCGEQE